MKRSCSLVTLLVSLHLFSMVGMASAQADKQLQQEMLVQDVIVEVQKALARVQKELKQSNIPPLQSVTLDLTSEAKIDAGGKINLYIVSFGHKWEKDRSQEVEITLQPPSPDVPVKVGKSPSLADQLADAIINAGKGVQVARSNREVPLVTSGLKVVFSFVVKRETSGGLKFTIAPVTAELSGGLSDSAIQKISVQYESPKAKK